MSPPNVGSMSPGRDSTWDVIRRDTGAGIQIIGTVSRLMIDPCVYLNATMMYGMIARRKLDTNYSAWVPTGVTGISLEFCRRYSGEE